MKKRTNRRGFSLGEILVAVAIMAVIAAVVIPSIGSQLNKGETGRVSSDLTNIRSAAEQFLADVRRYPSAMVQMTVKPLVTDTAMVGGVYSNPQLNRWKGPYMSKDAVTAALTGYGATMTAIFEKFPAVGQQYVTVALPGLTQAEATEIDVAMDDGVVTTGQIRWTTGTLRFLALPIQ